MIVPQNKIDESRKGEEPDPAVVESASSRDGVAFETEPTIPFRLTDLVSPSVLQTLLDSFLEDTSQPATILDDECRDIVLHGQWSAFCALLRKSDSGNQQCVDSDRDAIREARQQGKPVKRPCHAGLWNYCAPIRLGNDVVGYLMAGQFLGIVDGKESTREYRLASDHPAQPEVAHVRGIAALQSAYENLPWCDGKTSGDFWQRFLFLAKLIERLASAALRNSLPRFTPLLQKMQKARDLNALTDCVLKELPTFVHAVSCSIFLVQRDPEDGTERLVLQDTTWTGLQCEIHQLAYRRAQGLTGWVWAHGRSVRLANLNDAVERARYPGLVWAHRSEDSTVFREWLGVPIFDSRRHVIGVIRTSHCNRPEGFTLLDELAAQAAAREIGRAIEDQFHARTARIMDTVSQLEAQLLQTNSIEQLVDEVLSAMEKIFAMENARYFFERVRPEGKYWEIVKSTGPLPVNPTSPTIFSIQDGVAGKAIRTRRVAVMIAAGNQIPQIDYVDIIQRAEDGNPRTKSAMAAPIIIGDACFGALAVVADKEYAFFQRGAGQAEESFDSAHFDDVQALVLLAQLTASALATLDAKRKAIEDKVRLFRVVGSSVQHALGNWVSRFEAAVCSDGWSAQVGQDHLRAIRRLVDRFKRLIGVEVNACQWTLRRLLQDDQLVTPCKGVSIDIPADDLCVFVDGARTVNILNELIANAVDHGAPPVSVSVTIEDGPATPGTRFCCVHVRDSGPGIGRDDQSKLFTLGWTTDATHTGFGLFVCRYIAQLQGGDIDYREETQGAHFRLFLPRIEERADEA